MLENIFPYPTVTHPTTILGFVYGETRYENLDREESYLQKKFNFILNEGPQETIGGKIWALTHQQKRSHFGFLIQKPWCFHIWLMPQLQKECAHGNLVPGSEFGKYLRIGIYRWDVAGTNGRHWIGPPTIYVNFSFHLD